MSKQELPPVSIPEHNIFLKYPFIKEQLMRCWALVNDSLNNLKIAPEGYRRVKLTKGDDTLEILQGRRDEKPYYDDITLTAVIGGIVTVVAANYYTDESNPMPGFTCLGIDLPVGKRGGMKRLTFQNWFYHEEATPYIKLVDWIGEQLEYFKDGQVGRPR